MNADDLVPCGTRASAASYWRSPKNIHISNRLTCKNHVEYLVINYNNLPTCANPSDVLLSLLSIILYYKNINISHARNLINVRSRLCNIPSASWTSIGIYAHKKSDQRLQFLPLSHRAWGTNKAMFGITGPSKSMKCPLPKSNKHFTCIDTINAYNQQNSLLKTCEIMINLFP